MVFFSVDLFQWRLKSLSTEQYICMQVHCKNSTLITSVNTARHLQLLEVAGFLILL